MATIGQQLKQIRTERDLTIEDVAFHTRIPAARLRDMENDNLSRFANLTYARGFLKIYGEYLDLDLSEYLGQFHTEEFAHASGHEYVQTASATQNLPASVFTAGGGSRSAGGIYVLFAAIAVAGGIVWWNNRDPGETETGPPAAQQASKPAPAAARPAAAEPAVPPAVPAAAPLAEVAVNAPSPLSPVPPEVPRTTAPAPADPPKGPPPKAKLIEERDP